MRNQFEVRSDALEGVATTAVLELVARRGLTMPKAVTNATAVVDKLDEIAHSADPSAPELPSDPSKVEHVLGEAADRRVSATALRSLAAELRPAAVSKLNGEVRAAASGWVTALVKEFAALADTLRTTAPTAPRVGVGQVSLLGPAQFDTWSKVTNTILGLEEIRTDRVSLAGLLNEPKKSHWGSDLPLIAAVVPPSGDGHVVFNAFRERIVIRETTEITDATERWYGWLDLEARGWLRLALAPPHATVSRIGLIDAWPKAFQSIGIGDGGAAFQTALADSGETWRTLAVV